MSNSNSQNFQPSDSNHSKTESQSNVKKRHRRMKSSGVKNSEFDGKLTVLTIGAHAYLLNRILFLHILILNRKLSSIQMPMHMNSILFRWKVNNGILKRPIRRNGTNGLMLLNKKYLNYCNQIYRQNPSNNHQLIWRHCNWLKIVCPAMDFVLTVMHRILNGPV